MKKTFIAFAAAILSFGSFAQTNSSRLHITRMNVNKGDSLITLNMTVSPKDYRLGGNDIVTLTPILVSPFDSVAMTPMRIAGKQAWYAEIRDRHATTFTISRAGKGEPVEYSCTVPYNSYFEESNIVIKADTTSICNCQPAQGGILPVIELDYRPMEPKASFHFVAPKDSVEKIFNLSGKANIIFKVNRTEIDWSYAGNHAELDTILRTINVVKDNPDATVEAIYLTGYASPEGSYSNNVRLAKGRTEAVKDYVAIHSVFPADIYHTSSVPEDWAGLREWLEDSQIANRDAMIAFIDDPSISPEERNDIFRSRFPNEYPFLLATVYPSLRHTDYRIKYKVRRYYDVEEIRQVMRTNPRNLSLNELFILANSYEPGSPEYDEAFQMAARLYPDDYTANLNAANSSINSGRYQEAARYLDRAGKGPEVTYARGLLALKTGDLDKAESLMEQSLKEGIPEAGETLEEISRIRNFKGSVVIM